MATEHGTIAAYRRCPTKCDDCRTAMNDYNRTRRRLAMQGRPTTPLIDAGPVHDHVAELRAAGMSFDRIATAAGMACRTLWQMTVDRQARVSPNVARRILAVAVDDPMFVDVEPMWRLVHGMVARGYPMVWIARQIGQPARASLKLGERQVKASTATKIRALAEQCALTPGPSRQAERYAAHQGWKVEWLWEDLISRAEEREAA